MKESTVKEVLNMMMHVCAMYGASQHIYVQYPIPNCFLEEFSDYSHKRPSVMVVKGYELFDTITFQGFFFHFPKEDCNLHIDKRGKLIDT